MVDLRTRYMGLDLPAPLVASASPLTGNLDDLRRLQAAGAGAVVLPSLFQEQLTEEAQALGQIAVYERANYIRTLITAADQGGFR